MAKEMVGNYTMIIVSMFKIKHLVWTPTTMDNPIEKFDDVHVQFKADKEFLTSYYRDELKSKGIDADYDVRLGDDYGKRNPTYYNS
jgi:hypothetical protein